jgi:hypothetical protein
VAYSTAFEKQKPSTVGYCLYYLNTVNDELGVLRICKLVGYGSYGLYGKRACKYYFWYVFSLKHDAISVIFVAAAAAQRHSKNMPLLN